MQQDNFEMISRSQHRNTGGTFSSQSVLTVVQRFVSSVNTMNETIMVPSRLLDMDISISENQDIPTLLRGDTDAYAVYGILNATKNDLMYGLPTTEKEELLKAARNQEDSSDRWSSPFESYCDVTSTISNSCNTSNSTNSTNSSTINYINSNYVTSNSSSTTTTKAVPSRRISSLSMISVNSTGSDSSGTESDIAEEGCDEADSGLGSDESSVPDSVAQASSQLRRHLIGLYSSLTQLSEAAGYISDRYQEVISQ